MSVTDKGRFCNHCQKEVIDFTLWSDTALFNFFLQKRDTKTCGHFLESQLGRDIYIRPQPNNKLYRIFIGLGMTLLFSQPYTSIARKYSPLFVEYPLFDDIAITDSLQATISGIVYNSANEKVTEATVYMYENDTILRKIVATDRFGSFIIKGISPGKYKIVGDNLNRQSHATYITVSENETAIVNLHLTQTIATERYNGHGGTGITGGESIEFEPKKHRRKKR